MHIKTERTCIVCRNKNLQKNMIRIVKTVDGLTVGEKINGRGAYICNNSECINKLEKSKAINKTFKCNITTDEYNKIKEMLVANQ